MASLNHLPQFQSISHPSSSSSSSSSSFHKPHFQNPSSLPFKFTCFSSSPFTEKHSAQRYQRENWVYPHSKPISTQNQLKPEPESEPKPGHEPHFTTRDKDIASQLPELKKLLQVLREKRTQRDPNHNGQSDPNPANVFLVGTGPGDPDLLTLKALKAIQSADLILYDRLVSNDVLELISPDAKLLYVGKTAGYHSRTQEEIHELLLNFAVAGAVVVRLKGGDPLVFGRGGEEMDFLQKKGVKVKVIPGITAASGIAAELGIPLTHRGIATSVRYLTGHSRSGGTDPLFVAEDAADEECTLVVYMGLATVPALAGRLMECGGLGRETPAVAVERGTTREQRVVFARLENLAEEISCAGLVSPTLIIIGKVVALSPLWASSHECQESEMLEAK